MKKLLISSSIATLLLPSLAFAAFDSVRLNTSTSLSVNSITLNVSGSEAVIESIAVGGTTFTVTLQAGSTFEVSAPGLESMTTNQQLGLSSNLCTGLISKMGYTASSTEIVAIITPSSTLCTSATADTSGGLGSSTSGGGGGGATVVKPTVPVAPVLSTPEAVAAIKAQLIVLIQQLIAELIKQLEAEIAAMQASGSY